MYAAKSGHSDIARALLDAGADATATDKKGRTALEQARRNGNLEVFRILEAASR